MRRFLLELPQKLVIPNSKSIKNISTDIWRTYQRKANSICVIKTTLSADISVEECQFVWIAGKTPHQQVLTVVSLQNCFFWYCKRKRLIKGHYCFAWIFILNWKLKPLKLASAGGVTSYQFSCRNRGNV